MEPAPKSKFQSMMSYMMIQDQHEMQMKEREVQELREERKKEREEAREIWNQFNMLMMAMIGPRMMGVGGGGMMGGGEMMGGGGIMRGGGMVGVARGRGGANDQPPLNVDIAEVGGTMNTATNEVGLPTGEDGKDIDVANGEHEEPSGEKRKDS